MFAESIEGFVAAHIAPTAIGFMTVDKGAADPFGSGTLVQFSSQIGGILTCAHVLEEIRANQRIGIAQIAKGPNYQQRLQLETRFLDAIFSANDHGPIGVPI